MFDDFGPAKAAQNYAGISASRCRGFDLADHKIQALRSVCLLPRKCTKYSTTAMEGG